jgi:hypothetical protein
LRWYRFAYGRKLTMDELHAKSQHVEK